MDWFPLALLCALSLAAADALTKRLLVGYSGRELVLIRFAATGLLLLPLAVAHPLPPVPAAFWGWLTLLVPLEFLAMALYMVAIRDGPLHLTLPYLSFTPVFNVVTGWWLLGETVSPGGMAGIALVVAGAWLLNVRRGHGIGVHGLVEPFRAIVRERGSRLMLGVAAIYSITSVAGKAAMGYAEPLGFGAFYFVLLGGVALLLQAVVQPRGLGVLVRRPVAHLLVGGSLAVMVLTHFLALAQVEVAYMIAVKRTSLLFGILFGTLWFGERGLPRNLLAGGVMLAGVALILLGR